VWVDIGAHLESVRATFELSDTVPGAYGPVSSLKGKCRGTGYSELPFQDAELAADTAPVHKKK
jgi:hypothetical protein